MTPDIVLTDQPSLADRETVLVGLVRFNEAQIGPSTHRPLAVLLKDPTTGATTGGLVGATSNGWLFIEWVIVPEPIRGSGLGATPVTAAEAEALQRACHGAWLDTYDFQARGFYERL